MGTLLAEFGSTGTADGQFNTPHMMLLWIPLGIFMLLMPITIVFRSLLSILNTSPSTTITSAIDGNGASVQNSGSTSSNQLTFQIAASVGIPPITFQCSLDSSA